MPEGVGYKPSGNAKRDAVTSKFTNPLNVIRGVSTTPKKKKKKVKKSGLLEKALKEVMKLF